MSENTEIDNAAIELKNELTQVAKSEAEKIISDATDKITKDVETKSKDVEGKLGTMVQAITSLTDIVSKNEKSKTEKKFFKGNPLYVGDSEYGVDSEIETKSIGMVEKVITQYSTGSTERFRTDNTYLPFEDLAKVYISKASESKAFQRHESKSFPVGRYFTDAIGAEGGYLRQEQILPMKDVTIRSNISKLLDLTPRINILPNQIFKLPTKESIFRTPLQERVKMQQKDFINQKWSNLGGITIDTASFLNTVTFDRLYGIESAAMALADALYNRDYIIASSMLKSNSVIGAGKFDSVLDVLAKPEHADKIIRAQNNYLSYDDLQGMYGKLPESITRNPSFVMVTTRSVIEGMFNEKTGLELRKNSDVLTNDGVFSYVRFGTGTLKVIYVDEEDEIFSGKSTPEALPSGNIAQTFPDDSSIALLGNFADGYVRATGTNQSSGGGWVYNHDYDWIMENKIQAVYESFEGGKVTQASLFREIKTPV